MKMSLSVKIKPIAVDSGTLLFSTNDQKTDSKRPGNTSLQNKVFHKGSTDSEGTHLFKSG